MNITASIITTQILTCLLNWKMLNWWKLLKLSIMVAVMSEKSICIRPAKLSQTNFFLEIVFTFNLLWSILIGSRKNKSYKIKNLTLALKSKVEEKKLKTTNALASIAYQKTVVRIYRMQNIYKVRYGVQALMLWFVWKKFHASDKILTVMTFKNASVLVLSWI